MNASYLETTTHTVSWFLKRNASGELVLRAPFQRQSVWSEKQKSFLIDTILKGFPIPELYIQESVDEFGNEEYIVVDGQQRLRACIEFEDGRFEIDKQDSPEFGGKRFEELSPEQKQIFYGYKFIVRKLPTLSDKGLRDIFTRINRNTVQLNPQELRHATYWGEFIKCAESIAINRAWTSLGVFTPNDVRRMMNVEFVSELMIAYVYGPQNKKQNLDKAYAAFEESFEKRAEVERAFRSTISQLAKIFDETGSWRWRKKSDFYSLFLAFTEKFQGETLDDDQRAAIRARLLKFSGDVDAYSRDRDNPANYPEDVRKYNEAVERAASDVANRKIRHKILLDVLSEANNA